MVWHSSYLNARVNIIIFALILVYATCVNWRANILYFHERAIIVECGIQRNTCLKIALRQIEYFTEGISVQFSHGLSHGHDMEMGFTLKRSIIVILLQQVNFEVRFAVSLNIFFKFCFSLVLCRIEAILECVIVTYL